MTRLLQRHRQPLAVVLAACGTLVSLYVEKEDSAKTAGVTYTQPAGDAEALEGLIDASDAINIGAWWLDEPAADAHLSFDPKFARLVWQVRGQKRDRVTLDASTGEALAFDFE
ncbi:hypothetical protein G6O69_23810 [Pseudenhygromyxa sp. WMMC2535]|uniref:hypothetical protein n=1 Tax=Pseudenhygromyxa sp. WMMC2535 TaxID=2712867 RepID=UPI0015542170|nr:hypothetical protein [Pseudenhygromyxa sp. WMMC2535]NVB40886.1 hypothetical protein [Pseudenhygromyxa sp. WMMC2535]